MHINTTINNANSIGQLELVSEKAKVDITFFGHKYVYSEDYEGKAPLDTLVKKVMDVRDKFYYIDIKKAKTNDEKKMYVIIFMQKREI